MKRPDLPDLHQAFFDWKEKEGERHAERRPDPPSIKNRRSPAMRRKCRQYAGNHEYGKHHLLKNSFMAVIFRSFFLCLCYENILKALEMRTYDSVNMTFILLEIYRIDNAESSICILFIDHFAVIMYISYCIYEYNTK